MMQAPQFDGLSLDPFSLQQDGLAASEVNIGRIEIVRPADPTMPKDSVKDNPQPRRRRPVAVQSGWPRGQATVINEVPNDHPALVGPVNSL
ncbi:hypothetical protein JQK88_16190 [Mesorhizobium caraganae]|uniref:hypothetical protein n=1 Tax=Mesorhizobium caraganae TaxID=483206 RepID=UPI00193A1784|nr:hypothetical protein [Mesorhizobium caraganae]MBM2712756.1 hypothetical protein [Mesorhizobium caraganae]